MLHAVCLDLSILLAVFARCPCVANPNRVACQTTIDMSVGEMLDEIDIHGAPLGTPSSKLTIKVLGILQTITSSIVVLTFITNFAHLIILRKWRERVDSIRYSRACRAS